MSTDRRDEHLRAWLRDAAPPASAGSGEVDPTSLEAVMSEIVSTPPTSPQRPPGRERPWWVFGPVAATAAMAVLAVLVVGGVWWSRNTAGEVAAPAPSPTVTTITLRDVAQNPAASCIAPDPAWLRQQPYDLAVAGRVTGADDRSATIEVDRWYRGGSGPARIVVQRPDATGTAGLLYSPELPSGQRVLLVATGGELRLCDPTGPWNADFEQLYVAAFGPGTPAR